MSIIRVVEAPGWDAGARSLASFRFDGDIQFATGQAVGIVCGLNSIDQGAAYDEIDHALYLAEGTVRVIERGVIKTAPSPVTADAIYRIERRSEVVRYFVDDTLLYTSLTPSTGEVFADCSLYLYGDTLLGLTVTDQGGGQLAAVFPALVGGGAELDQDTLSAVFPALTASGLDDVGDSLTAAFPPLFGRGSELDQDVLDAALPALIGGGTEATQGVATLPALIGFGNEYWLTPAYNALSAELPSLVAFGWETAREEDHLVASFPLLVGRGSELDQDTLYAELPPLTVVEMAEQVQNYVLLDSPPWQLEIRQWGADTRRLLAELSLPLPRLSAVVTKAPSLSGHLALPLPRLTARTGMQLRGTLPLPRLTATITPKPVITGRLALPLPRLTAVVRSIERLRGTLFLPVPRLTARTGIRATLALPLPRLTATVAFQQRLTGQLTLPLPRLTATVAFQQRLTGHLALPLPRLTARTGIRASLSLPLPRLSGVLLTDAEIAAAGEVWLVNVATGALTRVEWGRFDKLITAHGKLYGLRDGVLHTLDADVPAAMTLRFAPQTFDTGLLKRCEVVYLHCREADGIDLQVIADERHSWPYATPTDAAPAYGTHKIKVGKGIRFHTLGLVVQNRNGGSLDLGGMELLIVPCSRRPR